MNSIKNSEKFNNLVKELASRLYRKKLKEITTTASIDTYQTPYAFGKSKRASKALKRIGYKNVKRKKRPYSTKLIDYLQNENNNSN